MKNYQLENIGKFGDVNQYVFSPAGAPIEIEGKLFLKEKLGLNSMEVSINKDLPNTGMNFLHKHKKNEELYIFISGRGEMMVDDDRFEVQEGSVVSVQPEAKRSWWNTGSEDLNYIVIQAPKNSGICNAIEDGEIVEGNVPWC